MCVSRSTRRTGPSTPICISREQGVMNCRTRSRAYIGHPQPKINRGGTRLVRGQRSGNRACAVHRCPASAQNCAANSLQFRYGYSKTRIFDILRWRRKRDSNPRTSFPVNGFQDRRYQPLTHSSGIPIIKRHAGPRARPSASSLALRSCKARMISS